MLTIDIGNSRVKWVLFKGNSVQEYGAFAYDKKNIADQMMQARVPLRDQVVWLSNVAGEEIASLTSQLLQEQSCVNYRFATTQTQQCGVRNGYRKPQQLGVDRWLAMLAAFHLPQRATGQSLCVVDCGTALTLDVLDATGRHLGGYIAPGLTAMREMLNQKLAHIDIKPTDPGAVKVLADNTADGVARGCAQVLLGGIQQMLEDSLPANEKPCIVLSGGDAEWVRDGLKLAAETEYEPLLVNKGLRLVAEEHRLAVD